MRQPAETSEDTLYHSPSLPQPPAGKLRNGKVARLPKELRDRINQMMRDGKVYAEILIAVREDAPHLNEDNLANWKSGGYTEWLRRMERREDVLAVQETIMDRVLTNGAPDLSRAAVQMALTKVFEFLDELPPEGVKKTMNSNNFTRLLNALVKLADGELKRERHDADSVEREARKRLPEKAGLSKEAQTEIEEHRFNPPPH